MPEEPTTPPKSGDDLLSIAQICTDYGVSRQTLHNRRADPKGEFPKGVIEPGSTRPRFRRGDLDAYFGKHPVTPGRRTDLESKGDAQG
ncbi:hypothetical protein ABT390_36685 [Streptomyces aurantiacus]|uniref:helix-turn-helix transcriptional regulator n=1 Tax=Streptomyces aurantiacus TaxID=47760 RepID=UPI0003F8B214|nr:hypothetical protein [Streptomyces aurantiacus]